MMRRYLVLTVLCVLSACAAGSSGDDAPGDDDVQAVCGDGVCEGDENLNTCNSDCGGSQAVCGDGSCNGSENANSCASDCGGGATCGDGTCSGSENSTSCPGDCPAAAICGDGTCNGVETQANCPGDCGTAASCGDLQCSAGEETSCPTDCTGGTAGCGDFLCDVAGGECTTCLFPDCFISAECSGGGGGGTCDHDTCTAGTALDSSCGSCEAAVCLADDYCCTVEWDEFCVAAVPTECGTTCP